MTSREQAYQRVAERRGITAAEVEAAEIREWRERPAGQSEPTPGGWFTEVQAEFYAVCRGE